MPWESPLYKAGVAQDDQLVNLDGRADIHGQLGRDAPRHKAGDRVPLRFVRRSGETVNATLALEEDPRMEVVLVEKTGGTLTDEQRRFRESWLGSLQKR